MTYRAFVAVLGAALLISHDSLRKIAVIDVPGPKGQRFDYVAIDAEDHYLLSAHLAPGILYVIDMRTDKLVKTIPELPGIPRLEYVPGLHKVYTSNWGEEKIGVVDLRTMSVIKRLPTKSKPNGIAYAEPFRKVYVANTLGKAVSVIHVDKDEIVKVLRFDSEPAIAIGRRSAIVSNFLCLMFSLRWRNYPNLGPRQRTAASIPSMFDNPPSIRLSRRVQL